MSKDKVQLLSPLFLKYQADYEKNPRSRVFAPLAETYRKLGMTDKAMEILAQGIRFHPSYVMGYLGLAFCYFDLKQYTLTYNTLRPLVETSRDNIRLQKLFADVCLELNYKEEALDAYKYLLFINPRDKEVSQRVASLENLIEDQYKTVHQPIFIPESEFKNEKSGAEEFPDLFDIDRLENKPNSSKSDFDDWKTIDLSTDQKKLDSKEDSFDMWNLQKGAKLNTPIPKELPKVEVEEVKSFISTVTQPAKRPPMPFPTHPTHMVEEDIHLDLDNDEDDTEESHEIPMVTHTLVDLYCGQGHIEKALEVLEKILFLNPHDQKTIKKISEIKALMEPFESDNFLEAVTAKNHAKEFSIPISEIVSSPIKSLSDLDDDVTEEEGRKNLMSILDQQLGNLDDVATPTPKKETSKKIAKEPKKTAPQTLAPAQKGPNKQILEEKLTQFLKKIQKRALDYQARV